MTIYTIGFTHKTAKEFFHLLLENQVELLVDIRLNNSSQLAGFTKQKDLEYFAKAIGNISYLYYPQFSPTKDLLKKYKKVKLNWDDYEQEFKQILQERNSIADFMKQIAGFSKICLLCSEEKADQCHRRLVAEYLKKHITHSRIKHL